MYDDIEERINKVINIIRKESEPSIAKFAREFDILYGRLFTRFHSKIPKTERPGVNQHFSEAEDLAICAYIKKTNRISLFPSLAILESIANGFLRRRHTNPNILVPSHLINHWRSNQHHGWILQSLSIRMILIAIL
jgi:hypothetical protein